MAGKYWFDDETKTWVDYRERGRGERPLRGETTTSGIHIIRDIEPYQAMGTDVATGNAPVIGGRRQHREFLKRNGYIEVGNEQPKGKTHQYGDYNVRGDLARAVHKILGD